MSELDKNLIKKNFQKSINSYEDNAFVQKGMATTLINFIKNKKKHYKNVLEIGSYSGVLTREFFSNFNQVDKYLAIDIVDSYSYIHNINAQITFQQIDFEEFQTDEKFDLIVSNAALQWANDFEAIINKFSSYLIKDGVLAITTFGYENMYEIKDVFDISLNYFKLEEIQKMFPDAFLVEDSITMQFENPVDILKHLKHSGVNSISKNKLNYKEIKEKLKILEEKYNNKITYNPIYLVIKQSR